jgi:uncharacterized protein (TIRG00374 family)
VSRFKVQRKSWRRWGIRYAKVLLILISLLLLIWIFRSVPLEQVWMALRQMNLSQIVIWMLVNIGIVVLVTGRWWVILRSLGQPIPILLLICYRLASFAVSYFTPGPQFGGEPVQVLALRQRHDIPATTGTASVGLDRLLELVANFSFLVFGIAVFIRGTWLPSGWRNIGMLFGVLLLVFPLAYLILILAGLQPLNRLVDCLPQKIAQNWVSTVLRQVEVEMSAFCVEHPWTMLKASLLSLIIWVSMICEYWLLTYFLGLRLSLLEVISALTAARLAILTPFLGGLGVLEFSQVWTLQNLGLASFYGISISLLIRFRDILLGLAGLIIAFSMLGWKRDQAEG